MTEVEIRLERYDSPVAQALVAEAMADLSRRYGLEGDGTPVSPAEFSPPGGGFFVAYLAGQPVGCAGWRSYGEEGTVAELKRMYTDPAVRGQGVARRLLATVEAAARDQGRQRMILESGRKQPEALSLYRSCGYERIPDFGYYRFESDVVSMGRDLLPAAAQQQ